jgi:hypothetical protein
VCQEAVSMQVQQYTALLVLQALHAEQAGTP